MLAEMRSGCGLAPWITPPPLADILAHERGKAIGGQFSFQQIIMTEKWRMWLRLDAVCQPVILLPHRSASGQKAARRGRIVRQAGAVITSNHPPSWEVGRVAGPSVGHG